MKNYLFDGARFVMSTFSAFLDDISRAQAEVGFISDAAQALEPVRLDMEIVADALRMYGITINKYDPSKSLRDMVADPSMPSDSEVRRFDASVQRVEERMSRADVPMDTFMAMANMVLDSYFMHDYGRRQCAGKQADAASAVSR